MCSSLAHGFFGQLREINLSNAQQEKGDQYAGGRCDPKARHDFRLMHPERFEVVVQRGHSENTLAGARSLASILVVAGLQEDRGCLGKVHDPDEYTTPMSIKSSSLWTMSIPVPTAPTRANRFRMQK